MDNPGGQTVTSGAADRFWHMRAWAGMNASGWLRALIRNRLDVSPQRVVMAAIQTGASVFNSSLGLLQQTVHGRRIARTELADDPLFVIGHWRSGTTLLHELLVHDPQHTCPNTYCCFGPNHFLLSESLMKRLLILLLPRQRPMDSMAVGWDLPQEDEWALCNMGVPSPYLTILFPNRPVQYPEYFDLRSLPPARRQHWQRRLTWFLKCLTVREAKRIVLKNPLHTFRVRALLEAFPGARFVHIARNPFDIFPSTMHTWQKMYRYHGVQVPRFENLEQYVLDTFCHMFRVFEEDVALIPPGRFCEIRYEDLVNNPVQQMQRVYEQLGLEGLAQARPGWEAYAARTAGYQRNRYALSDEQRQMLTRRWAGYFQRYGYQVDEP
jgi:omega-hydroxy-beta-dihydromenaquinone-9 sulfotransferase